MTLAAGTVWECNASATASGVNGGGFNPGNANFLTDATTDSNTANTASPVLSSASYNFVAGDVGHWVYIKSGTNWTPGWYKIASVASNKATLDADVGEAIQTNSSAGYPTPIYATNTVAGCATVGTPTNGVFGIDYSQGTAAIINNTDLACPDGDAAAPTVTSAGSPFGVNHVGNLIHITAGTGYTASWYEIVSVSGTTATLDRAIGTDGAKTNGTFYVGGAFSMNSALDDDFFESKVAGNRVFFKSGTFTAGEAISISVAATDQLPVVFEGYNTLRGDAPTGSSRPTIAMAGSNFSLNTSFECWYMQFTGTGTTLVSPGTNAKMVHCKSTNSSTAAARPAFVWSTSADLLLLHCEAVSYRGRAVQSGNSAGTQLIGCYFHDSDVCLYLQTSSAAGMTIVGNLFISPVTAAISFPSGAGGSTLIMGNTIYGSENTLGIGVSLASGGDDIRILNNIIYGFATGVSHADSGQLVGYDDFNDYYNNDTDVTSWIKGSNCQSVDPEFTNIDQITGSGATSGLSDNILTDGTKDFTALGVVAGRDFIYLISGTNTTVGIYGITTVGTTTLTLDLDPSTGGTGSDIVYQITINRDLSIGDNLKGLGGPAMFPGVSSVSYPDIGSIQREEPAAGGGLIRHPGMNGGLNA